MTKIANNERQPTEQHKSQNTAGDINWAKLTTANALGEQIEALQHQTLANTNHNPATEPDGTHQKLAATHKPTNSENAQNTKGC